MKIQPIAAQRAKPSLTSLLIAQFEGILWLGNKARRVTPAWPLRNGVMVMRPPYRIPNILTPINFDTTCTCSSLLIYLLLSPALPGRSSKPGFALAGFSPPQDHSR
ncbi:hypothetical protein AV530_018958 [Patagioenas fasciata monilis]|uniref:Uncharacterized protein n=1 Tax=Patagioenas fasciata monilis TaxID=372326 RepID=A0A1V4J5C6_PATFA|nr:hypothetical protein AV530_018958 [Patagioenas fasciata monilis]